MVYVISVKLEKRQKESRLLGGAMGSFYLMRTKFQFDKMEESGDG